MQNFSIVFKRLRKQNKFTQKEIAEKLQVSQSTVGMWETGKRLPSPGLYARIADLFSVPVDVLYGREEDGGQGDGSFVPPNGGTRRTVPLSPDRTLSKDSIFAPVSQMEKGLSARLALLREMKGVSARDMSLSLGLSESYINRVETGKMMPSMAVFFEICKFLGVTPYEFFNFVDSSEGEVMKTAQRLQGLPESVLEDMRGIIEALAKRN